MSCPLSNGGGRRDAAVGLRLGHTVERGDGQEQGSGTQQEVWIESLITYFQDYGCPGAVTDFPYSVVDVPRILRQSQILFTDHKLFGPGTYPLYSVNETLFGRLYLPMRKRAIVCNQPKVESVVIPYGRTYSLRIFCYIGKSSWLQFNFYYAFGGFVFPDNNIESCLFRPQSASSD